MENIGVEGDALFCVTNLTACCQGHAGENRSAIGDWFLPNATRVPSESVNATQWDFYRDREKMMVLLHRRRNGVEGIYSCEIPDSMNVIQTIYIGVYTAKTGKLHCLYTYLVFSLLLCLCCNNEEIELTKV